MLLSCKNGEFYEFGIGMYSFLPIAYVIINKNNVNSRLKRLQIYLSGSEVNFFVGGIGLIFAGLWDWG